MNEDFDYRPDPSLSNADRRRFLNALIGTVTAAALTGGAAALLLDDDAPLPLAPDSRAQPSSTVSRPPVSTDTAYLQARLSALEAENSALQSTLSAAQRQLASYAGQSNIQASDDDYRQQFEEANAQLADLTGRLGILQGLLTLYEEFTAVDLAAAASSGLAALGGSLGTLALNVPDVVEGLQAGRQALEEFEGQLPLVEQGRYWLEGQLTLVRQALTTVETTLDGASQLGGTFLQLLNRWFDDILRWLPFGIGQRAQAIMTAIGDLLGQIPDTLDGLQRHLADPLDLWLERDGDDSRLKQRLIKPVRHQALDRFDTTIGHIDTVNTTYESQLRQPVATLIERQQQIRDQITQYRQTYTL